MEGSFTSGGALDTGLSALEAIASRIANLAVEVIPASITAPAPGSRVPNFCAASSASSRASSS